MPNQRLLICFFTKLPSQGHKGSFMSQRSYLRKAMKVYLLKWGCCVQRPMLVTTYVKPWSLLKTNVGRKLRPQKTTAAIIPNNPTPYQPFAPSKATICCVLAPRLLRAYNHFAAWLFRFAASIEALLRTKKRFGAY